MKDRRENDDIGRVLSEWPYDPRHSVRVRRLRDGRDVLQVRLPLGIEQYEMDGRPDGRRPCGAESLLDYHLARLARATESGRAQKFSLTHEQCLELFDEGTAYYNRYLRLFQLEDWKRVVRDTNRNLTLFDFVHHHATRPRDGSHLEKWRPYVMRMRAVAMAMMALAAGRHESAVSIVRETRTRIHALSGIDDETFEYERDRALEILDEIADHLVKSLPLNEVDLLERELHRAVRSEQFERAARLRDRIQSLRNNRVRESGSSAKGKGDTAFC